MRSTSQLSITLPVDMVDMIKGKVASGAYASDSEVVREGLRALAERDLAVERWLRDEVVPTAIAHAADPSRAIPGEEIFDRVIGRIRAKAISKVG